MNDSLAYSHHEYDMHIHLTFAHSDNNSKHSALPHHSHYHDVNEELSTISLYGSASLISFSFELMLGWL
jgi:hypothetical protein